MKNSADIETTVNNFYRKHLPSRAEDATVIDFASLLNEKGLKDYAERVNDHYFDLMTDEGDGIDSIGEDTLGPGSFY
ncbi:MAG: hypothetical protein ABIG93_04975 [archaeon]